MMGMMALKNINLTNYNASIIQNPSLYTFEYYSSLPGAQTQNSNNLISDFTDHALNTGFHTLFVRVDFNSDCYEIANLNLTVVPLPVIPIPDSVSICENGIVTLNASMPLIPMYGVPEKAHPRSL